MGLMPLETKAFLKSLSRARSGASLLGFPAARALRAKRPPSQSRQLGDLSNTLYLIQGVV